MLIKILNHLAYFASTNGSEPKTHVMMDDEKPSWGPLSTNWTTKKHIK